MGNKYIGITIGPIYDAIMQASSPASLWGSSFMFSHIARRLCEKIVESGFKEEDFLVPYFEIALSSGKMTFASLSQSIEIESIVQSGVGLLHDRIIFRGTDLTRVSEVIREVKDEIAEGFIKALADGTGDEASSRRDDIYHYFRNYLQISAVCEEVKENPVLEISSLLDGLELEKGFVSMEKSNYILELFENAGSPEKSVSNGESSKNRGGRNARIKNCFLMEGITNWFLINKREVNRQTSDYGIRDLGSIAASGHRSGEKRMKKSSYYAVVQCDGDNMGKVLASLNGQEDIRNFSKKCLLYSAVASRIIEEFGGVPLFAGGDDLLFLSPVEGKTGTILKLLMDIGDCFNQVFAEEINLAPTRGDDPPALSCGVSVQYIKAPLYEALKGAANLLFGVAKNGDKNTIALNLQKHSGQSLQLAIRKFNENNCLKEMNALSIPDSADLDEEGKGIILKSMVQKLAQHESLFATAFQQNCLQEAFANTFDSGYHKRGNISLYIQRICNLFVALKDVEATSSSSKSEMELKEIHAMISILRWIHFNHEEGGDES